MGLTAASLDRRVQFRRRTLVPGPFGVVEEWANHGLPVAAGRRDISDGEKFAGGGIVATIDTRFTLRASGFTRDLSPVDRLICEGRDYNIIGIKQVGPRRAWLELTCSARAD